MAIGSLRKFFHERGGTMHNGNLSWPGTAAGFPFRGTVPDLRQTEFEQIEHVLDFHSRLFLLWDPVDKAVFDDVMDRISNGWFLERKRVDRWSDTHCGLIVWLEWVQIYGEIPTAKHPGA